MRILVITDRYPPYYTGGYEIACQSVMERLRKRGHEVCVLVSNYGLHGTRIDGHVHRVLHRPQDSPNLFQLARWERADNRALMRLLNNWQPDIISTWSMLQLFPSLHKTLRSVDLPVISNLHDLWLPRQIAEGDTYRQMWIKDGANILKQIGKGAVRTAMRLHNPFWLEPVTIDDVNLNRIVFCSDYQRKRHDEAGLPLENWCVIYNGLDLERFNGTSLFKQGDKLKVLFVGRLVSEKGAHIAIQAISEMLRRNYHQVSLHIAGVPAYPFEYSESLHQMVQENNLQNYVEFLGMVDNQELPEIYRRHDVLVFPSTHLEGLPMTLLEAMACGLTVVGTNSGGNVELLEDRINSLILSQNCPEAVADCLVELIDNPTLLSRLANAGQQLARERFDIETIASKTESYLLETIKAGKQAPNHKGLTTRAAINT